MMMSTRMCMCTHTCARGRRRLHGQPEMRGEGVLQVGGLHTPRCVQGPSHRVVPFSAGAFGGAQQQETLFPCPGAAG